MRVDSSRIRKEKVADSKISGYVWTGPKCAKNYNAREQPLFSSLNLLFGDVLVDVAVMFCVRSLISNSPFCAYSTYVIMFVWWASSLPLFLSLCALMLY